MTHEIRLIYFILFRLFQSNIILPDLGLYIISCLAASTIETATFFSPWHPFFYAVETLSLLTDNLFPVLTIECFEEQEAKYTESLINWYTKKYLTV